MLRNTSKVNNILSYTFRNIQYVSDLHIEYRKKLPIIEPKSENLIIAGDIGDPFKPNYKKLLNRCSNEFQNIFIVSGNHEYWSPNGATIDDTDDQINDIVDDFENVHYMKNKVIYANNLTIIGCTLWSNILKAPNYVRGDDNKILDETGPILWNGLKKLHKKDVNWLINSIDDISEKTNNNILAITHHLPTYDLIHPFFKKRYPNTQDRFASDLDYLIKKPIIAWICGHSHCVMNIEKKGVYLGINSLGYPKNKSQTVKCTNKILSINN